MIIPKGIVLNFKCDLNFVCSIDPSYRRDDKLKKMKSTKSYIRLNQKSVLVMPKNETSILFSYFNCLRISSTSFLPQCGSMPEDGLFSSFCFAAVNNSFAFVLSPPHIFGVANFCHPSR
jgi:hypothetical protein